MISGAGLILISFIIAISLVSQIPPGIGVDTLFPNPESLFDTVTEQEKIQPNESYSFQYSPQTSQVPLMWGIHVVDYQPRDDVSISVTNTPGDKLDSVDTGAPIFVKSFMIPKVDTYNFEVANKGQNPVTVTMMFTENPEKSKALKDTNSPFFKNILPLAVSGFLLIIGIIVLIIGIIISVRDWKKGKNQSRYV